MSIRCPWCGSPVTVRGSRWECGWCGDCGDLSSLPDARRAATGLKRKERAEQINRALVPLEQGAFSILEGMRIYCGGEEGAQDPLWKLTAYGVSRGLRSAGGWNLIGWGCSARFSQSIRFWTQRSSWPLPRLVQRSLLQSSHSQKNSWAPSGRHFCPRSPPAAPTLSGLTGYAGSWRVCAR